MVAQLHSERVQVTQIKSTSLQGGPPDNAGGLGGTPDNAGGIGFCSEVVELLRREQGRKCHIRQMKRLSSSIRLPLLTLAVHILTVNAVCQKREIFGELSIPGHHSLPVRYNVCVDSTTISPEPSMTRTGIAVFARDCCGCRVSSVTERELRLQTANIPSVTRSIYVPEIRACECIPCDSSTYNWADYFTLLHHKRRK
ncbi:hypothetical protein Btru_038167 [Bulinus truncatus]|nr:hypothetical protein Btru_038167 [Bulinus truncatus]